MTAAGFEPLLKFAYTSKLLFSGDNVADIRNSANALGFTDLEEACFDFLVPKFSGGDSPAPFLSKTCCKKKCKFSMEEPGTGSEDVTFDDREEKPVADSSSQQEVSWCCDESANIKRESGNGTNQHFRQCPKYRRQLACEREICRRLQDNPAPVIEDKPGLQNEEENENHREVTSNAPTLKGNHCNNGSRDADVIKQETNETEGKSREMRSDLRVMNKCNAASAFLGSSLMLGEVSSGLILNRCPLKTWGDVHTGSLGEGRNPRELKGDKKIRSACEPQPTAVQENRGENKRKGIKGAALDIMEKEVAEHMAKRLGSDLHSSLSSPDLRGTNSSNTGNTYTPPGWMDLRLASKHTSCSFFGDSDQNKCSWRRAELSECEGASHSGVSSFNSGEDGDSGTETEGDSESYARERAKEVGGGLMYFCVCVCGKLVQFPVKWADSPLQNNNNNNNTNK